MFTRGKDSQAPGKFAFTIYGSDNTIIAREGGFETAQEADRAAERAHREHLFPPSDTTPDMTDAELLEQLGVA